MSTASSPPEPPVTEPAASASGDPAPDSDVASDESVLQALGAMRLFDGLSVEGLRRIRQIAVQDAYPKGAKIFSEGELGDKLYLLLEGKVRISRQLSGAGEEALTVLGPGESFGEMALVEDGPRSADAIVHEAATLLTVTREAFDDLLFLHKDLAYEVLWNFVRVLSGRLRETNDKVAFMSATGRF